MRDVAEREHVNAYPTVVTLQNGWGDYLAESRVVVRWDTGEHRLLVGQSAVIQFMLEERKLPGLKIIAPQGYDKLRQRSIPLGDDPEQKLDLGDVPFDVNYDGHIDSAITRGLTRLRVGNQSVPAEEFREQLRRNHCTLDLPPPHDAQLSAGEIYKLNRDSVVVVVHAYPDGSTSQASGFVLDPAGVIHKRRGLSDGAADGDSNSRHQGIDSSAKGRAIARRRGRLAQTVSGKIDTPHRDGALIFLSPFSGTPAHRARSRPGDVVPTINGVSTRGLSRTLSRSIVRRAH